MPRHARKGPPRLGPRPLPLHLLTQAATLMGSPVGLSTSSAASPFWRPPLAARAAALAPALAAAEPEALRLAVAAEARMRFDAFLRGIQAYRAHPYRRSLTEPPVLWRQGTTRLLDYGADSAGPPVLVVPSLVNRYYVLDLTRRRSLVRHLAAKGLRPLVVDWGAPGPDEAGFGFDDYIGGRLATMFDVAAGGGRAAVAGYCMGGLLALGLAALRPRRISALALLATPWDFHAADPAAARLLGRLEPYLSGALDVGGGLPVDALQALFASVDPGRIAAKFRAFAELDQNGARARDFVALEDWVNDGVPLTAAVARECLFDWYGRNAPALGRWRVAGIPVRPAALAMPTLVVVPGRDRIVPPESALALVAAMPGATVRRVDTGHVGMVAGRSAKAKVYAPLAEWLAYAALQHSACADMAVPVISRDRNPTAGSLPPNYRRHPEETVT